MSSDTSPTTSLTTARPTIVRHYVLAIATVMSILLYLDRFVVSIASEYIREDLRMTQTQVAWFTSLFFWTYALCQVPAGWFGDRFGTRVVLTVYIVAWSIFTGLMGVAEVIWLMLILRLACGCSQAGAYPTVVGLIRHWSPLSFRGTASSIVALGGRFGAVLAPVLTPWFILAFASLQPPPKLSLNDILDGSSFLSHFDVDREPVSKTEIEIQRRQFVERLESQLSTEEREELKSSIRAGTSGSTDSNGLKKFVDLINDRIGQPDFIDFSLIPVKVPDRGHQLLKKKEQGASLTEDETILLNRVVMETLFRTEIRKSLGAGWRPTVILYGLVGLLVALGFFVIVRNSPREHPKCNEEECDLIELGVSTTSKAHTPPFPWRAILTDISLWGNCLCQFTTNIGWFFVVSPFFPRYLNEVHSVPLVFQGYMAGLTSGVGIVFLFAGGRCTDWMIHNLGLKWGRRIPLVASRFVGAAGCLFCVLLGSFVESGPDKYWLPWLYVIGLGVAASATDFGSPAIWAYAQDVGGKYTASILGWGNMWGNLGAAVSPLIYNLCVGEHPTIRHWNLVFGLCGGAFILSGLFAFVVDASKKLVVQSFEESIRTSESA